MMLKGIEFGRVWGASGVQGFFGEGYWYHYWLRSIGLNFDGATFVAKTTTLNPKSGNMPLREDFTPKERLPKCIKVIPRGYALNAVGLSGPGAEALFDKHRWQRRKEPFFISFMSVAPTPDERMKELRAFVALSHRYLRYFDAPVGLQINYSCPNVGLHVEELVSEVERGLTTASALRIPIVPKFNVVLPPEVAVQIADHPNCDAICVSNTIPWGQLPDRINWKQLFGTDVSPLAHLGGGGLSGKPLLPLLIEWLERVKSIGISKPINAGGGILSIDDAERVFNAGADSIFLGSIAFLRPWRVRRIISAMSI